ncbi:hypothetical protein BH23BAC1_BH23BAC1_33650 [soil metagenome]
MAIISVQIEVLNPKELIGKKKGKFIRILASMFMNEKALKKKVDEQVVNEILTSLKENLEAGLSSEGVKANLNFSVDFE